MTGGYIPVYVSDIIAILVLPHFRKGHTSPFKSRMVFSGEDVLGEAAGFYVDLSDFPE